MKYCQGPKCHTYHTKDRIRGPKGSKRYETRRRSSFYYGNSNFCSVNCTTDWLIKFVDMAINRYGRITEPKYVMTNNAWYKTYDWRGNGRDIHYIANDLLGQRIPITEQQYNDDNFTNPNGSLGN